MPPNRRNQAISLLQATQEAPSLARLAELVQDSNARLQSIQPLLPPGLRAGIKAGPIDDGVWCLLLQNSALAAKLRQLLPQLEAHLRSKGWQVTSIRLKVQAPQGR